LGLEIQFQSIHKEEADMKSMIATRMMVLAVVIGTLALPSRVWAAQCSKASAAGTYGYTTSGFVSVNGAFLPVVAVGRIVFDAYGNVNGTQTRVVAGSSLPETFSGNYDVGSDCKGTVTVVVQPDNRTSNLDVVWIDNSNGARAVFTNPGFTLTVDARRLVPRE
jgi:hypothetical protein